MLRMSPHTRELIEQLYKNFRPRVSFWHRMVRPRDTSVIDELGRSGEPTALACLRLYLLHTFRDVRSAAARAVAMLLDTVPAHRLPEIDRLLREAWLWAMEWQDMNIKDVAALARMTEGRAAALGLACCHSNGFIRAAAIQRIAEIRTGEELPFLLLRCNDWVPPIRNQAFDAVEARLTPEFAVPFGRNLGLLQRRDVIRDPEWAKLKVRVADLLRGESAGPALASVLESDDRHIRRGAFDFVGAFQIAVTPELHERACHSSDGSARYQAVKLAAGRPGMLSVPVLMKLAHDRVPAIRRFAWTALSDQPSLLSEETIRHGLLDTNWTVRTLVQHHCGTRPGGFDARAFYAGMLDKAAGFRLAGALRALGDDGARECAALVLPHLADRAPVVRKAALYAVAKLRPDGYLDLLRTACNDSSRTVAVFARRLIARLAP